MAVRTYADDYSTQWAKHLSPATYFPSNPTRAPDDFGRPAVFFFEHTQGSTAGDATSTQGLFYLPAGRWRPHLMKVNTSAFGSSRTLDIGFLGYTERDGDAVAADPNAFADAKDVSAALVGWDFNVATWLTGGVIESIADVGIISTVAGGTIPAAATIKGWMSFLRAE